MSVKTKSENYLNYITGSAGGWPSNTNIAITANMDYIIESGSDNVYFNEMNTACGVYGSYNEQSASFDLVADYANEKGCTTAYVYGQNDDIKRNPSSLQEPIISESFAKHGISVNFEYNNNTSHTYFAQRGQSQYTGSFHLFIQTPWYSDDTLLNIVSGSFNKNTFRTILSSSPESSSLVPLFDTGSFSTSYPYHPDFVVKNPTEDTSLQRDTIRFYKYIDTNSTYQDAVDSGSLLIEKFIVPSASVEGGEGYNPITKECFWMTPDRHINYFSYSHPREKANKFALETGGDRYHLKNVLYYTSPSGSLITMYDNSTKQIQDVEVGDVVKSYLPVGMPDEIFSDSWNDYTTTDLTGSTPSGSVVVRTMDKEMYGYYLANGSIKLPVIIQGGAKLKQFFIKDGDTWSWKSPKDIQTGQYFLDTNGDEVEITSLTEVSQSETFYSLDVEDIDTYFSSNILVHNIPQK